MTDDYPANESEATADRFQWFFDLAETQDLFGQRVSARLTEASLRDLTTASFGDNAHEVRLAWQMLLDTMGPVLTSRFIYSGAWKKFCPDPAHDKGSPSLAVLWRSGGKEVVGRVTFSGEQPTGARFDVE